MPKGLDDFQRKLTELQNKARDLHGTHDIPLHELLNDRFISSNTGFASLTEMTEAYGPIDSADDLATPEWSTFIASHTRFADWQEMLKAAGAERAQHKLGL